MPTLVESLNKGHDPITVTSEVNLFEIEECQITSVLPRLREHGRIFAGGRVILRERLDALLSKDPERIEAWCRHPFDFADACIVYEDRVKFQPDSPLLTGIIGEVKTSDGYFIAIDAESVREAANGNMKNFKVRISETIYSPGEDKTIRKTVRDVVLLPYARRDHIELNPDQFESIAVETLSRNNFTYNRNMNEDEIVKRGKVIHPAYRVLYPKGLIRDLAKEIFVLAEKEKSFLGQMGIYLPCNPEIPEMRHIYVTTLQARSEIGGDSGMKNDLHIVGVYDNKAD